MHLWHSPTKMRRSFTLSLTSNNYTRSTFLNQTCKSSYLPRAPFTNKIHRALSVDTSGDFIAFKRDFKSYLIKEVALSSLFDIRRAYDLPDIDFASTRREVPTQPNPISAGPPSLLSGTLSWF